MTRQLGDLPFEIVIHLTLSSYGTIEIDEKKKLWKENKFEEVIYVMNNKVISKN